MKTMPKSTKEEKFRWIKPILDKEISIKNMAECVPFQKGRLNTGWLITKNPVWQNWKTSREDRKAIPKKRR